MRDGPPPPPLKLKPGYKYGKVCEFCYRNILPGLFSKIEMETVRQPDKDLHFCDHECLTSWRYHGPRAEMDMSDTLWPPEHIAASTCYWCGWATRDRHRILPKEEQLVLPHDTLHFCDMDCLSFYRQYELPYAERVGI